MDYKLIMSMQKLTVYILVQILSIKRQYNNSNFSVLIPNSLNAMSEEENYSFLANYTTLA
jgi:hypothetical protein